MILFHGTHTEAMRQINHMRKFDLNRCKANSDFGPGIYTTTNFIQVQRWANYSAKRFNDRHPFAKLLAKPHIIKFALDREQLAALSILFFIRPDADYWNLVRHCKLGLGDHGRKIDGPWYEVVAGQVASADLRTTLHGFDQISFHTNAACAVLYNARV